MDEVICMKNLFDRETAKKIKQLNEISGLDHRSKPYDINNKDDLKEMLRIKVCALLDYTEYEGTLNELLERLDESIEYYDAATWLSFTMDTKEPDKLLTKCYDTTRKASDNFRKLIDKTFNECLEALIIVFNKDEETQKYIIGFYIDDIEKIQKRLDELSFKVWRIKNAYIMDEAYNNFIVYFEKYITKEQDDDDDDYEEE